MTVECEAIRRRTLDAVGSASLLARLASATDLGLWSVTLTFEDHIPTLQHGAEAQVLEGQLVCHCRGDQKAQSND